MIEVIDEQISGHWDTHHRVALSRPRPTS